MMLIRWISIDKAKAFIRKHHRHRPLVTGGIVAIGLWVDEVLTGVAVLGRPARMDSKDTVSITRLATDGYPNACSKLYAKAKRLGHALGFVRIKTFTLLDESGASLRAVQAKDDGQTSGGPWSREGRPRSDVDTNKKQRWAL